MLHDVIILGGGYAGMAAALQIARARRRVLVIDTGQRRNRFAAHSHGFIGQDGSDPAEIARQARDQILAYPTVTWIRQEAIAARPDARGFVVTLDDGTEQVGRRLILAPGVRDTLPDVPGLQGRWGRSVFHCPYCHGYELDGPLGVLATGRGALTQALLLSDWGPVTLFLNKAFEPDPDQRRRLEACGVSTENAALSEIRGRSDVVLADGRVIVLSGLFVIPRVQPASPLFADLGCEPDEGPQGSFIRTDALKQTTISGVFACGDAARSSHSVSMAVGDGALAGQSAHRSLDFD